MTAVVFEVQNHLAEDIQIDSSIGAHFVVRAGQAAQVNLPTEDLTKLWVVIARPGEVAPVPMVPVPETVAVAAVVVEERETEGASQKAKPTPVKPSRPAVESGEV